MKRVTPAAVSFLFLACSAETIPSGDSGQQDFVSQAFMNSSPDKKCGPSVYSAVLDFEPGWVQQANPSGVWSYGWSWTLTGSITLYPLAVVGYPSTDSEGHMWIDPEVSPLCPSTDRCAPSIFRHTQADQNNPGLSAFDAGALIATPGEGGSHAHAIFTAPLSGLYSVAGRFYAQQYGINADVHVLVDGKTRFSQTITSMPESHSFALFLPLQKGTKVDFVVGPNGQPELHPANVAIEAVVANLSGSKCPR